MTGGLSGPSLQFTVFTATIQHSWDKHAPRHSKCIQQVVETLGERTVVQLHRVSEQPVVTDLRFSGCLDWFGYIRRPFYGRFYLVCSTPDPVNNRLPQLHICPLPRLAFSQKTSESEQRAHSFHCLGSKSLPFPMRCFWVRLPARPEHLGSLGRSALAAALQVSEHFKVRGLQVTFGFC
jgi:hypothetical protein